MLGGGDRLTGAGMLNYKKKNDSVCKFTSSLSSDNQRSYSYSNIGRTKLSNGRFSTQSILLPMKW